MTFLNTSNMEYRYLGNTGLRVSVISFGNMNENSNEELIKDLVQKCLEKGINFFDTAEAYGLGKAEETLGKAFKALNIPREKIVVTTKIFACGSDPNDMLCSRKHIIEGLRNSLKRLQMNYVDIVFSHKYDMNTPMEEVCRAMNFCIKNGMAFYWGTSDWTACQIEKAYKICEKLHLIPPIVEQVEYNMLEREKVDSEYRDLFKDHHYGIMAYSPLKKGILAGAYLNGISPNSGLAKLKEIWPDFYYGYKKNEKEWCEKIRKLKEIAEKKLNCSMAQLAIAWIIKNPDVTTCLLGCSSVDELEDNIKGYEVCKKLNNEILLEIEKILENSPKGECDYYRYFKEMPIRRNQLLGIDFVLKNK